MADSKPAKKPQKTSITVEHSDDGEPAIAKIKGPLRSLERRGLMLGSSGSPAPATKPKKVKAKTNADKVRQIGILANLEKYQAQGHDRNSAMERVARNLTLSGKFSLEQSRSLVAEMAQGDFRYQDGPEGAIAPAAPVSAEPSVISAGAKAAALKLAPAQPAIWNPSWARQSSAPAPAPAFSGPPPQSIRMQEGDWLY